MLDVRCLFATFLKRVMVAEEGGLLRFMTIPYCETWLKDETMRLVLLFVLNVMNMEM